MIKARETLQSGSLTKESPNPKIFIEYANNEIEAILANEWKMSSSEFIIEKIQELNPKVEIKTDLDRSMIFASESIEKLKLPKGFYYSQRNEITNKRNTQSGVYGSVHVYPIEYYDPNFF